jgi:carotenoid cleavage dioxygenase-like enzyme
MAKILIVSTSKSKASMPVLKIVWTVIGLTRYLIVNLFIYFTYLLGTVKTSPFLEGNYGPIHDELTNALLEHEEGTTSIPKDFPNGIFIRNGSNPQFNPRGRYHWFDGDGMIHGVSFSNGTVKYTNRFVRTEKYEIEKEARKPVVLGLQDLGNPFRLVDQYLVKRLFGVRSIPAMNAANTSLIYHAGKCLATYEGSLPYEIDLPSLSTVGIYDFKKAYSATSFTAHPKIDPVTGEMICFSYSMAAQPFLYYHIIDKDGKVVHSTPFNESPHVAMMHDFAVTEHYSVFMFYSLVFDVKNLVKGKSVLSFDENLPIKIAVVPRYFTTGDKTIKWFNAEPGMIFHHANAFEKDDEVIVHSCRLSKFDFESLSEQNDSDEYKAALYEYRLNMKTNSVKEGPVLLRNANNAKSEPEIMHCDFPVVNAAHVGRYNRYIWAGKMAEIGSGRPDFGSAIKVDLEDGTYREYSTGGSKGTGEWVHVSTGAGEDDGYVVGFMYDEKTNTSTAEIVNAKTMSADSACRYIMPRRIPYGFHGTFVSEEEMSKH